jgi:non-heme chloroperoxidase
MIRPPGISFGEGKSITVVRKRSRMDATRYTVAVNGTGISYIEQGSGDPVLFMHGSLGDYRSWGLQMATFAERYRVIAVSRRRHWPNPWPANDDGLCSAAAHAADLAAFIDELDLGPCHLVGSSYGALAALTMTVTRPDLVRTLVLGEPPLLSWLRDTDEDRPVYDAFQEAAWLPAGRAFERGDPEEAVRRFITGVIGDGAYDRMPPQVRADMMDNAPEMGVELRTPPDVYFPRLTRTDVAGVTTSTLLLTGSRSPAMFHRVTDHLAACLPSAERAEIPDASHSMHGANPVAYNRTVLAFLACH